MSNKYLAFYFDHGPKQMLDFRQRTGHSIFACNLPGRENLVSVATSLYIWRLIATAIAFQVSLNTTASMLLASSFTLSSRPTRARSSCGDTNSSLQQSASSLPSVSASSDMSQLVCNICPYAYNLPTVCKQDWYQAVLC